MIETQHDLTDAIHELATLTTVITAAQAKQQATVEAAKKAFEEATREETARLEEIRSQVEAYCAKHKATLFPGKAKTCSVLQHKLQYRSSTKVTAPADVVARIQRQIDAIEDQLGQDINGEIDLTPDQVEDLTDDLSVLTALLRVSNPELNKKLVPDYMTDRFKPLLKSLGIDLHTEDTFNIVLTLSPNA